VGELIGPRAPHNPFRHPLSAPWFYRLGFAAAARIPKSVLYGVADFLGMATYLTCGPLVRTVRSNLARAFPLASSREAARLVRRIFRNYARYLVDYGRFRWSPPEGFATAIPTLEGEENLRSAIDAGRGVILVTGHVGNWELGGAVFGHYGVKVNVVTLPDGSRQIDAIREAYRGQNAIHTIVLDGSPFASLEMRGALMRGEMVAMLVDRWGKADGVTAPFFGRELCLPRGPFVLSRVTGAPILPAFVVRDGASHRGILEPPLVVVDDDLGPSAQRVSAAIERVIRRFPEQWYNFVPL
jgi:lauroyl/myristoyl acyltransferase